jgi:hypothetical protein
VLTYYDPSGLRDWVWPWDPNASWNPSDTWEMVMETFCDSIGNAAEYLNNTQIGNCMCGIAQAADIVNSLLPPVGGVAGTIIGGDPATGVLAGNIASGVIEAADCGCSVSKALELSCKSTKGNFNKGVAAVYAIATAADCFSLVPSMGLFDTPIDIITTGIENMIASQGEEVLPVGAAEACCQLLDNVGIEHELQGYIDKMKEINNKIRQYNSSINKFMRRHLR